MGIVGEAADAAGQVAKVIKSEPSGQEAVRYTAEAAEIVTHTLRNLLLPFAAINFGVDKAKRYFEQKFASDLDERLASIPSEQIAEPKASIAGPAIQGIAYSVDDSELREMYLNLLAGAMNSATADTVHPAYIEIVKQLTSREALMLRAMARDDGRLSYTYPIVKVTAVRADEDGGGHAVMATNLLDDRLFEGIQVDYTDVNEAVDNWVRLGLFTCDFSSSVIGPGAYDFVDSLAIASIRDVAAEAKRTLDFPRGILRTTEVGLRFFDAVT